LWGTRGTFDRGRKGGTWREKEKEEEEE